MKEDELVYDSSVRVYDAKHNSSKPAYAELKKYLNAIMLMKEEMGKVIVGQEETIETLLSALICNGHVLVEGVPGIAKTLLIKALARVSGCSFSRIQFTVDLLPSDIVGLTIYTQGKGFETVKGPIFANFIIADEINRSPPKTQSALIEAMQEQQVTIGKETYKLPLPFFVMANQNPLETSGVYTLPEAQIDRFIFKVVMNYPTAEQEEIIMEQNATLQRFEDFDLRKLGSPALLAKCNDLIQSIYLDPRIKQYIASIVIKTRTKDFKYGEYIEYGGSPRASIALYIASKAHAFLAGRNFVIPRDVKDVAHNVLRHRLLLSYRAKVEGVTPDIIIDQILNKEVPVP